MKDGATASGFTAFSSSFILRPSSLFLVVATGMDADAGGLRAIVGASRGAIELAVARDALARLHQAVATLAGAFDGLSRRHRRVSSTGIVCPVLPEVNVALVNGVAKRADEVCGQLVLKADEFPFAACAGAIILR